MRGNRHTTIALIALQIVCAYGIAQNSASEVKLNTRNHSLIASAGAGRTVRWSGNGQVLVVCDAGDAFACYSASGSKLSNARGSNPRLADRGNRLMYRTGQGLAIAETANVNKPIRVLANATHAAFSPDSTRVAAGSANGLAIIEIATGNRREIVKGHPARCESWSKETDIIAFVDQKGYFLVVRPNGTGLMQISKLDADEIEWSPNGRWILAHTPEGWQAIQPGDHRCEPVVCDNSARPTWTGGQKLAVVQNGTARKLYLGAHDRDESLGQVDSETGFYAPAPEIEVSNDSLTENHFRGARKPNRGDLRVTGYVETADALDGKYVLRVESVTDANGRESVYMSPPTQPIAWSEGARQTDGKLSRNLQAGDLRDDDRLTVIVRGDALNPGVELPLREAWVEGEKISSSTGESAYQPELGSAPHLHGPNIEYDGITREKIVVPMVFPIAGKNWWEDWFLAPRGNGKRRHHGQDLMAKKMTPLVACFDGVVRLGRSHGISGFSISLDGDNGYRAFYCHINNDTPGTDDDQGGDETAFAPGLVSGMHVKAGQFIGYVGNSGNAKTTDPHCHFEIKDCITGAIINPAPSLRAAIKLSTPGECALPGSAPRSRRMEPSGRGYSGRRCSIGQATLAYWPIITRYSEQYHLVPELIAAVIQQESDGNPRCVSRAGAMGLMQLMPENCHEYGVEDPYSPEQNIRGGTAQLADHLKRFGGDVEKGLAAYNAGPGHVLDGSWRRIAETRNYVPKVLGYYESMKGQPYAAVQSAPQTGVMTQAIQLKPAAVIPNVLPQAQQVGEEPMAKIRETNPNATRSQAMDEIAQKVADEFSKNAKPQAAIQQQIMSWARPHGIHTVGAVIFATANGEKFAEAFHGRHLPLTLVGIACRDMGGIQYWAVVYGK